ncbi:MAG: hypothetical protein RLZZ312_228, partial [Bacteroidota bacterium]
ELEYSLGNADLKYKLFNLYVQDESRFGLLTRNGRALTAVGVKPICNFQLIYKYLMSLVHFLHITEIA